MIITKTPLRVSLVGGGTDFPNYFDNFNTNILTTAIDKYIYITLNVNTLGNYTKLSYSKNEIIHDNVRIEHPIIRALFQKYNIKNVDLHVSSDVPAGTGLGSSSSFTVGLIRTIHSFLGIKKFNEEILDEALEIEFPNRLSFLGLQDFIPPIYGGIIHISLGKYVRDIDNQFDSSEIEEILRNRSCLVPVGSPRSAQSILLNFNQNIESNFANLHKINEISTSLIHNIKNSSPFNLEKSINDGWEIKKLTLNQDKNRDVMEFEKHLKSNGVESIKLCGAGESGYFLCIFSTPKLLEIFQKKFSNLMRFDVDRIGSSVIYNSDTPFSN
jgi:D-glycero-alpha-D-manno-heptose-7-phosphate kinase